MAQFATDAGIDLAQRSMIPRVLSIFLIGVAVIVWGASTCSYLHLAVSHRSTSAQVLSVAAGKWIDTMDLQFVASDGDVINEDVNQVWIFRRPAHRQTVHIDYDPAKPTRVRIEGQHTYAATTALCCFFIAVVAAGTGWSRRKGPGGRRVIH